MIARGCSLWRVSFALFAVVACDGEREAPSPVDRPPHVGGPGSTGSNNDGGSGAGSSQGGFGGGGASTGGGGTDQGGAVPVFFPDCGCALETLNTQNAECDDCVQTAQEPDGGCFERLDACLVDPGCLPMLQELPETCRDNRTIECAEGVLAGMPRDSAETYVAYYECICTVCSDSCVVGGEGGGGGGDGGGGSAPQPFCEIAP